MRNDTVEAAEIYYAAGYVRRFLEDYSRSATLPIAEITSRVAALLCAQEMREELGPSDRLSTLRRESAKRDQAVESVEMAGSTHRKSSKPKRTLSARARNLISKAQKARWAKSRVKKVSGIKAYWQSMTAEERKAENRRRRMKIAA